MCTKLSSSLFDFTVMGLLYLILIPSFISVSYADVQSQGVPYGEMGIYGDLNCFQGDSSRYYGGEAGVRFSPFRYTDVGIGFSFMSGNHQSFTFVNGSLGLFSPELWKLRVFCGMCVGIQTTAPAKYWCDCDWSGRDSATGGWALPYCGLSFQLKESDSGIRLRLDSRIAFTDTEIRRISTGIVLIKSIFNE